MSSVSGFVFLQLFNLQRNLRDIVRHSSSSCKLDDSSKLSSASNLTTVDQYNRDSQFEISLTALLYCFGEKLGI